MNASAVLITVLVVISLAGLGFYMKSLRLHTQVDTLLVQNDKLAAELEKVLMSNQWLTLQNAVVHEDKEILLADAVAQLNEKSQIIESILTTVGVDIKVQESMQNSGGKFTDHPSEFAGDLILKTDKYLETVQNVPIGAPVPGVLTSRFGWRSDPINGERAYHRGLDIRGRRGADVKATAAGTVIRQRYDKGDGHFILLDHGNGFRTKFAHLQKSLVKKGDQVIRGQVIGLVGNSGRSTGPHVHYEIHYDDKIVNPTRFVRINRYLKRYLKKLAAKNSQKKSS
ncbi:MAG: M23 family metallopeptidase [Proteobacteria bacterium]|nr:M23 family metallopeptidase [Pseudomonadota bacterium]